MKLFDELSINLSITDAILSVPESQDSEVRIEFMLKFLANDDNFSLSHKIKDLLDKMGKNWQDNTEGMGDKLKDNLKNEFQLSIVVKENIDTLDSIKMLYKKELIAIETQSEDFQKVLAKFPNAKIIDIEELERGDGNDG